MIHQRQGPGASRTSSATRLQLTDVQRVNLASRNARRDVTCAGTGALPMARCVTQDQRTASGVVFGKSAAVDARPRRTTDACLASMCCKPHYFPRGAHSDPLTAVLYSGSPSKHASLRSSPPLPASHYPARASTVSREYHLEHGGSRAFSLEQGTQRAHPRRSVDRTIRKLGFWQMRPLPSL